MAARTAGKAVFKELDELKDVVLYKFLNFWVF